MSTTRRVGRNLGLLILGRFAVLAVWLALTPLVLARLGADRFGFWSLLLVIVGTIGTVDLGLGIAISRYVSESAARRDHAAVRDLVLRAALLQLGLALLVAGAGFLARESLLDVFRVAPAWRDEARSALVWALFGFVAVVPFNVLSAALQGLQRMDLYAAAMVPGALALLAGMLVGLRSGAPLVGVIVAQVLQFVFSAALLGAGLAWTLRSRPGETAPETAPIRFDRLLRFGGWVQANAALGLANQQVDKLLLGAWVALSSVAAYELGMRVMGVAMLVPQLGLAALLPVVVQREAAAHPEARLATYRSALGPFLALVGLMAVAMISLAEPLLEAWLGRIEPVEVFALRGIALAGALTTVTGVASTMVRAAERPELETQYGVAQILLHVTLSAAGLVAWGWRGLIAGLVLSSFLAAWFFVARVERWLAVTRPSIETARALAGPLVAAGIAGGAALLLVAATRHGAPGRGHGVTTLALAGATMLAVYLLALARLSPPTWQRARALLSVR